jgi:uncharacterized protein DUF4907
MIFNIHSYSMKTINLLLITSCILSSCTGQKKTDDPIMENASVTPGTSSKKTTPPAPSFSSVKMDMKTFEVKDSITGRSLGWGYDIYADDHKTIHQPILPGIPGNNYFKTEDQAKKTGSYVLEKMKKAGTLVSVTPEELDQLGITK